MREICVRGGGGWNRSHGHPYTGTKGETPDTQPRDALRATAPVLDPTANSCRDAGVLASMGSVGDAYDKGYASHCTSFERFGSTLGKGRRCESFRPWALTGGTSPGCSYKHSFLSV